MIRALSATFLALVLAVTSVTLAVARAEAAGRMPGVAEVVICADGMAMTVMVDAAGNPVAPHAHHCPDCLLALAAPDADAPGAGMAPAVSRPLAPLRPATAAPFRPLLSAAPRGPPVLS